MISLHKNNYLRYSGSAKEFKIDIDPIPNTFSNLYKESVLAAEEIYDLKQGKLHIMYSGGLDSEFALSVFLSLGMDVTPVIIKLNPGYNDYDQTFAFAFCQEHNLKPIVIDIDFNSFVSSGKLVEIAKMIKSPVYHMPATAYAAGLLDGSVIAGDGECYMRLNPDTHSWNLEIDEHDYAVYNYFKLHGIDGTTHFNRYTAGQMGAFMLDPMMRELAEHRHPGKLGSNSSKIHVYNRHSPFRLKERTKATGYEKIEKSKIFEHDAFKEIAEFGKTCNGLVAIDYHNFIHKYIQNVS